MKMMTVFLMMTILAFACNNNKNTNSGNITNESGASISKSEIYGKWKLDNALIKVGGPDGKPLMTDTMKGATGDYYLIDKDGTIISHVGTRQDTGKFHFINDHELVGGKQMEKDSAHINILSLSTSACTISFKQKKSTGSVDMTMYLTKQ
ncbi:hypothetical protein [Mucilaginibacter flavidus]|uniref:hypothetical protein n=1 Tax=Mucilaginibacter flavidus TaxID=2949309 RepID=UPI00209285B9|nr:hypothetical protein [Mucilaginibacter flavidus]MCO5948095.1 hypothetical protein [Mucilaginibacter flavidus]